MSTNEHGGQIYAFGREQAYSTEETFCRVLDFSASINPVQPNIDWQALSQYAKLAVPHYPDTQQHSLKHALAKRFKLPSNQITLTNGISSAIISLFSEIKPDRTLLFTPIYSEYQRAAVCYSKQVIEFNPLFSASTGLSTSLLQHINLLTPQSVVVLVNPSTPQGHYFSPDILAPLLQALQETGCWLFVDESFLPFISFAMQKSLRGQLHCHPKMLILHSLTKYYACPGVRIGAIFSAPQTLDIFAWPSWPISALDEQFLLQALNDPLHDQATQSFLKTERPRFIEALNTCALIESVQPSVTNFVFVTTKIKASFLVNALRKSDILIRDCQSFGLGDYACRIAIRTTENNQALINALHLNAHLLDSEQPPSES